MGMVGNRCVWLSNNTEAQCEWHWSVTVWDRNAEAVPLGATGHNESPTTTHCGRYVHCPESSDDVH